MPNVKPQRRSWHSPQQRRLSIVATVALATLAIAFPAQVSAASNDAVARHCVARLAHLEPGETTSRVLSMACYQTFAEAIDHATNGKVHLGPNATPDQLSPEALASSYVLGIDFQHTHFSGASFTATGDTPCTGGHNFAIDTMPETWNNVVSSNYPSSGCDRARHWDGTYHTGALIDCRPSLNCYYIGDAMNDRSSSEEWFDV